MGVTLSTWGRRTGGGTEREWRECERRKTEVRLRPADGVGYWLVVSLALVFYGIPSFTLFSSAISSNVAAIDESMEVPMPPPTATDRSARVANAAATPFYPALLNPPPPLVRLRLRDADGRVDGDGRGRVDGDGRRRFDGGVGGGDGSGEVRLTPPTATHPSTRVANARVSLTQQPRPAPPPRYTPPPSCPSAPPRRPRTGRWRR